MGKKAVAKAATKSEGRVAAKAAIKVAAKGEHKEEPEEEEELVTGSMNDEMTLEEKMKMLKDSQNPENASIVFSRQEWQKLYNRFNQTQIKSLSLEGQQAWQELKQTKGRSGKSSKMQGMIKAFIVDGGEGEFMRRRVDSIIQSATTTSTTEWVSHKAICQDYSDSELSEAIQTGEVTTRRNPKNPKRLQYKRERRIDKEQVKKQRTAESSAAQLIDSQEWKSCTMRMKNMLDQNRSTVMLEDIIGCSDDGDNGSEDDALLQKNKKRRRSLMRCQQKRAEAALSAVAPRTRMENLLRPQHQHHQGWKPKSWN